MAAPWHGAGEWTPTRTPSSDSQPSHTACTPLRETRTAPPAHPASHGKLDSVLPSARVQGPTLGLAFPAESGTALSPVHSLLSLGHCALMTTSGARSSAPTFRRAQAPTTSSRSTKPAQNTVGPKGINFRRSSTFFCASGYCTSTALTWPTRALDSALCEEPGCLFLDSCGRPDSKLPGQNEYLHLYSATPTF